MVSEQSFEVDKIRNGTLQKARNKYDYVTGKDKHPKTWGNCGRVLTANSRRAFLTWKALFWGDGVKGR